MAAADLVSAGSVFVSTPITLESAVVNLNKIHISKRKTLKPTKKSELIFMRKKKSSMSTTMKDTLTTEKD